MPEIEQLVQHEGDSDEEYVETEIHFWYRHLSPHGALITRLGTTYSIHDIQHENMAIAAEQRWEAIDELTQANFSRIIDYDISAAHYYHDSRNTHYSGHASTTPSRLRFPINMAVAFKSNTGLAYWRLNEAHYNLKQMRRLSHEAKDSMSVFDSATMLQLQFPPTHSSWFYCESYTKNLCEFHGYDPEYPNVPLQDLYVSKSKAGENAGRGVFANVDIAPDSNVALETTTNSIHLGWTTTRLHRNMMRVKEYATTKARIVNVYSEAYGYENDP
jgi:hypothetical protein